jgi:uncharacterized protein YdcH (DUF465 family)
MTHDLIQDFPEWAERIRALKASDPHFARLCESYDEINFHVHRAETRIEPVSEAQENQFRRSRSRLKDQILLALAQVEGGR